MSGWPIVLPCRLKDGELFVNRRHIRQLLEGRPDGPLELTIDRKRANRSVQANAYYWAVVLKAISDYTGYDVDETHEAMKALFLPKQLVFCDGNGEVHGEIVVGGSTRKMTTGEFYDYVEKVRRFAAEELKLVIPDPDPNWQQSAEEVIG